jgi:hypothetical protein
MTREKQLIIALLTEKLQRLTNKKVKLMEAPEVAVLDLKTEVEDLMIEIKDSFDFASAKLYNLIKISNYIKRDYPELAQDMVNVIEPMMIDLEKKYPNQLEELLTKFK